MGSQLSKSRRTKKPPYWCAACKKRFADTDSAERHVQRDHAGTGIILWNPPK